MLKDYVQKREDIGGGRKFPINVSVASTATLPLLAYFKYVSGSRIQKDGL